MSDAGWQRRGEDGRGEGRGETNPVPLLSHLISSLNARQVAPSPLLHYTTHLYPPTQLTLRPNIPHLFPRHCANIRITASRPYKGAQRSREALSCLGSSRTWEEDVWETNGLSGRSGVVG